MRLLSIVLAAAVAAPADATSGDGMAAPSAEALDATVAALDAAVFDAFNRCSDPAQLERHARYFAEDVEFYHDTGGVTWTREAMLEGTRRHVCGQFTREIVPGTLRVYPIKDFGAIAQGTHRFCPFASGRCEGIAEFTMVWRFKEGDWQVTRVLSYGHRAAHGDD